MSSTMMPDAEWILLLDKGRRFTNAPPPPSSSAERSVSTLERRSPPDVPQFEDDDAPPHSAARVMALSHQQAWHALPPRRRQIQPPHVPHNPSISMPAAYGHPRERRKPLPGPQLRRLADPHKAPRPDDPQVHGDDGLDLGE